MRVNVDDQALDEPRIKRMAKRLGCTRYEVLGRILHVWMLCYQRRSAVVDAVDIDITADLDGFAEAMVAEAMADRDDDAGAIYVRGVSERIGFLERQRERAKLGGRPKKPPGGSGGSGGGNPSGNQPANRSVNQTVSGPKPNGFQTANRSQTKRSAGSKPNSPDQAPDLDLSLAPDQAPDLSDHHVPAGEPGEGPIETAHEPGDVLLASQEAHGGAQGDDPHPEGAGGRIQPPTRADAPPARKPPPDPPAPALTTAAILLDYLVRNHPESKLAKCTDAQRESTLVRWAHEVRLMHEVDRHDYGVIQAMIHWSQRHSFWRTVILSAGALRAKWDQMHAQRTRPPSATRATVDGSPEEIARQRRAASERSEAERAEIAAKQQRALEDRAEVQAALGELKQKLGIAPLEAEPVDAEPEPEEDETDAA